MWLWTERGFILIRGNTEQIIWFRTHYSSPQSSYNLFNRPKLPYLYFRVHGSITWRNYTISILPLNEPSRPYLWYEVARSVPSMFRE